MAAGAGVTEVRPQGRRGLARHRPSWRVAPISRRDYARVRTSVHGPEVPTTSRPALTTWSGCRDLNPGPLDPQSSALTKLRHSPSLVGAHPHADPSDRAATQPSAQWQRGTADRTGVTLVDRPVAGGRPRASHPEAARVLCSLDVPLSGAGWPCRASGWRACGSPSRRPLRPHHAGLPPPLLPPVVTGIAFRLPWCSRARRANW